MPSFRLKLLLCILSLPISLPGTLSAQSTAAEIDTRLKEKQLYLRGFWGDRQLHFNSDGTLAVPSAPLSFTVAGFKLKSAKLTKDGLTLRGKRVGLELKGSAQKRIEVENLDIDIAKPTNEDYGPALEAIFAEDLRPLVPTFPTYWKRYAQCILFPSEIQVPPAFCTAKGESYAKAKQVGGAVSAPKIEQRVDADYSSFATEAKYTGTTLVALVVDTTGKPTYLRVVAPAGLGLDEQALAAIQKWKFTPAMEDGKPVAAEVQVQIAFHFYRGFHFF